MEPSTRDLATSTKERWQWKSNQDPWSKTEPAQWESYSLEHNYLIEKAYYDQQKEIDIEDYIVSIKDMIQKKKGSIISQKPIRRIKDESHEMDRSTRYSQTELPKTVNRIFGSLGHFISFFSRRNSEILDFSSQLEDIEKSNDLEKLNHNIIPKLVHCLEEVLFRPNEYQLKDATLSGPKKKTLLKAKEKVEELISLFKKEFVSFEEFYRQILRGYTMNTDLCQDLNKSLRNESWVEIDKLLPYAFCLCKAFFNFRLEANLAQADPIQESKTLSSIILYRGTAFDEFALSSYNLKNLKCFSWNSVTSTSTSKEKAEEFMYKNTDIPQKKYPVMFLIQIPLTTDSESEYLRWIDIHQYSAIPKEEEVILAPGSTFELVEVSTDQDKRTTIKLTLRNEIKSLVHGEMTMQGTLQSQMMTEKVAKIMCLEGEELDQALMSLCENKLIEELEFCLCTFDRKLLSQMFEILPTLEKTKRLKFIACKYEGNGEIAIEESKEGERSKITKIEVIEANDFFQKICNERQNQEYWGSLKELDLDFSSKQSITDEELNCAVSQGFKYLPQLTHLSLNFEWCKQITDEGILSLTKGFNSLTQLTYLNLKFEGCQQITNEGVSVLMSQGVSNLTRLISLILDFDKCEQITDQDLHIIAEKWLKHLISLKSPIVKNKRLQNIETPTKNSLASSRMKFIREKPHENKESFYEEVSPLQMAPIEPESSEQAEKFLTQDLVDAFVSTIGDNEGMIEKKDSTLRISEMISEISHFSSLTLNFEEYRSLITDELVHKLSSQVLRNLLQLRSLTLTFRACDQITDKAIHDLSSFGLKSLINLVSLKLDFSSCGQITNKGVDAFVSQGLQYLTQLKFLVLDFSFSEITDDGVSNLILRIVKDLPKLTFLDLNLDGCSDVSDLTRSNVTKVLHYFGFTKEVEGGSTKIEIIEANDFFINTRSKGIWQWKSYTGFLPLSQNAEWKFYSFDHNELIEEAYFCQRDVETDNYIISPINLTQTEKGDKRASVPIRRIGWVENEEMESTLEMPFETELPKAIGSGFGNLSNFISFIKALEVRGFAEAYEEIEASNDLEKLKKEIISEIVTCFQNEVRKASSERPSESIISSLINSLETPIEMSYEERILVIQNIIRLKMEKQCRNLTQVFAQELTSFHDFYACILRVYTMGTFLYRNLNRYLRDETWDQLHALLPYLFCICKAFFSLKTKVQPSQEQKFLTLFRGTRLDNLALDNYNPEKAESFSWNSITSTTSNIEVAKKFLNQIVSNQEQTVPVLFKIEIPVTEELEYLRYLNVTAYSAIPKEDEVILPPGSAFELQTAWQDNDQMIVIDLKLKSDILRIQQV